VPKADITNLLLQAELIEIDRTYGQCYSLGQKSSSSYRGKNAYAAAELAENLHEVVMHRLSSHDDWLESNSTDRCC
jgi:hypothetical protein